MERGRGGQREREGEQKRERREKDEGGTEVARPPIPSHVPTQTDLH